VHDRRHRINNAIESFHSALMRYIQCAHPNIFVFLGTFSKAFTFHSRLFNNFYTANCKLKVLAAAPATDLATNRKGNKSSRPRKVKYLIRDARIHRASSRLENKMINVGEFLQITAHMCYNPNNKRHCATGKAPDVQRPTLTARRRGAPQPINQQIDSNKYSLPPLMSR